LLKFNVVSVVGVGIIIAISISKTRKITVIVKNRRENLFRDWCSGSKPHSNGLLLSLVGRE